MRSSLTSYNQPFVSTMSDLTSWTQSHLIALYQAHSETQLDESFDSVFSSGVEIFINQVPTTRDDFKKNLEERAFAASRASVEWKDKIPSPLESPPHDVSSSIVLKAFTYLNHLTRRES